jgi:hypothetical protein
VSKPDLIELSTDWDTALRVADRYTGLGGERGDDEKFLEQGARLLAGVLVIANHEGKGYRWLGDVLEDPDYLDIEAIIEESTAELEVAGQHLRELVSTDVPVVAGSSLLPTACSRRRYSPARFLIPTSTRTDPSRRRKRRKIEKFDGTFSRVAHVEHGKQGVHRQLPSEERQSQCHRTRYQTTSNRKSTTQRFPMLSVDRPEQQAIYPWPPTLHRGSRLRTLLAILKPLPPGGKFQSRASCSRNCFGG